MPLDPNRLMQLDWPVRSAPVETREALLYALAVGLGANDAELGFVCETALKIAPTFALTLAFDDSWIEPAGVSLAKVLHGGLDLSFEAPLRAPGAASIRSRMLGLEDKGAGRGAVMCVESEIVQDGATRCRLASNLFVRGEGGFGGSRGSAMETRALPGRPPDLRIETPTARNQALLYRLLGDRNALHVDPAVARAAGFERPILHGACTFGVAGATMLRAFCGLDPARLKRLAARFAGPVYPGETLAFSIWREEGAVLFRAEALERGAVALDNGLAEIAA